MDFSKKKINIQGIPAQLEYEAMDLDSTWYPCLRWENYFTKAGDGGIIQHYRDDSW